MNLESSLNMHSSKSTVFPLPVGAEITIFTSERKQEEKHSLCNELKYLYNKYKLRNNTDDTHSINRKISSSSIGS